MSGYDSLFDKASSSAPDFSYETQLIKEKPRVIAGVDEVGRGPLAGPVVTAAVVLDPDYIPSGLNDSKKLTEIRRNALFTEILSSSHVAWTSLNAETIDRINIREATLLSMTQSVFNLPVKADHVLVDGRDIPTRLVGMANALIKGDQRSVSIAAASIVAKVIRDRMMVEADLHYPQYGFASHKGYGSKMHREAILRYGPCPIHRKSFSPIKQILENH